MRIIDISTVKLLERGISFYFVWENEFGDQLIGQPANYRDECLFFMKYGVV